MIARAHGRRLRIAMAVVYPACTVPRRLWIQPPDLRLPGPVGKSDVGVSCVGMSRPTSASKRELRRRWHELGQRHELRRREDETT